VNYLKNKAVILGDISKLNIEQKQVGSPSFGYVISYKERVVKYVLLYTFYLTYLINRTPHQFGRCFVIISVEQSPSRWTNSSSVTREIPQLLWYPKVHCYVHENPPINYFQLEYILGIRILVTNILLIYKMW